MIKPVPERLADLGQLYGDRNAVYGDDFRRYGRVLLALMPDGIRITNEQDANRLGILTQMIAKFGRYCAQFAQGGHPDSLDDLAVYSQILAMVDDEGRTVPFFDDGVVRPFVPDPDLAVSGMDGSEPPVASQEEGLAEQRVVCQQCHGDGEQPRVTGLGMTQCFNCDGRGTVKVVPL